jgi:hypothetical protein
MPFTQKAIRNATARRVSFPRGLGGSRFRMWACSKRGIRPPVSPWKTVPCGGEVSRVRVSSRGGSRLGSCPSDRWIQDERRRDGCVARVTVGRGGVGRRRKLLDGNNILRRSIALIQIPLKKEQHVQRMSPDEVVTKPQKLDFLFR